MLISDAELRKIIKHYALSGEELYRIEERKLAITASGIRKIVTTELLNMSKRIHFGIDGMIAVIARVESGHALGKDYRFYEAVGEAKHGLNTTFKYPIAVAEARANGRAVLMYMGLYEKGIIAEAELDMETLSEEIREKRKAQTDLGMKNLLDTIHGGKKPKHGNKSSKQERDAIKGPEQGAVAPEQG